MHWRATVVNRADSLQINISADFAGLNGMVWIVLRIHTKLCAKCIAQLALHLFSLWAIKVCIPQKPASEQTFYGVRMLNTSSIALLCALALADQRFILTRHHIKEWGGVSLPVRQQVSAATQLMLQRLSIMCAADRLTLLTLFPSRCNKGSPIGMSSAASRSVIACCTVPK